MNTKGRQKHEPLWVRKARLGGEETFTILWPTEFSGILLGPVPHGCTCFLLPCAWRILDTEVMR